MVACGGGAHLVVLLHGADEVGEEPDVADAEDVAEAREALGLEAADAADEGAADERERRHRRHLVDEVAVEVVDRRRRAPRVEVGGHRARLQELGDRAEVRRRHLLRDGQLRDEEHVAGEEGEFVGEDLVRRVVEEQRREDLLARVLDLGEVEGGRVERRAHEQLRVRLLRLRVPPRVEPLAEEAQGRLHLVLVARVVRDEPLLGRQPGARAHDLAERRAQVEVVRRRRAHRPAELAAREVALVRVVVRLECERREVLLGRARARERALDLLLGDRVARHQVAVEGHRVERFLNSKGHKKDAAHNSCGATAWRAVSKLMRGAREAWSGGCGRECERVRAAI